MSIEQIIDIINAMGTILVALVGAIFLWGINRAKNEQIKSKNSELKVKQAQIDHYEKIYSPKTFETIEKQRKILEEQIDASDKRIKQLEDLIDEALQNGLLKVEESTNAAISVIVKQLRNDYSDTKAAIKNFDLITTSLVTVGSGESRSAETEDLIKEIEALRIAQKSK